MAGFLNPSDTAVLSVIHFALAASVTTHVLANKRDPGSAVAWIGLAWLSPVVGSILYALLGINRVQRRARSLSEPLTRASVAASPAFRVESELGREPFAALEEAGRRISQRPTLAGNDVAMLHSGDEAYPAMVAAIESAQRSVALSSYIFRADAAGEGFIAALMRARGRGVELRVLIDGFGGGYLWSETFRRLRKAGVPVARFLHSAMPWRMPFLNLRTHRKILIVDGATAFTGGLNIGAENLLASQPRYPVRDTHFRFTGPVVAQLSEAFAEQWWFATGEALEGDAWLPALSPTGPSLARVVTSGPDQDLEKIELLVLAAVGCARESVHIMTPYFLPDDRIITALVLASLRGVAVDIVLPEHSNHRAVDWAMRAHIRPLVVAGCRIWTQPAPFDHSKLMTIDGAWCFVGSANWDARSFRLNFEINVEVFRSSIAGEIAAKFSKSATRRISLADLDGRSLLRRFRDSAARLLLPYL
jgi:cardiolipin synthase